MRKLLGLLCSFLIAIFIAGSFPTNVKAADVKTLELVDGYVEYTFKPGQETIQVVIEDYSTLKMETSCVGERSGAHLQYYLEGNNPYDATAGVTSWRYCAKGTFTVKADTDTDITIKIAVLTGDFYFTKNGVKEKLYQTSGNVILDEGEEGVLSFEPREGSKVKCVCKKWSTGSSSAECVEGFSVSLGSMDRVMFEFDIHGVTNSECWYAYPDAHTVLKYDRLNVFLVDKGCSDLTMKVGYESQSDNITHWLYDYRSGDKPRFSAEDTYCFPTLNEPFHGYIATRTEINYTVEGSIFVFIKEEGTMVSENSETDLTNVGFVGQRVVNFTPSKDGQYTISTEGSGDPAIAVFDEKDNLVAFYNNDVNEYDDDMIKSHYSYLKNRNLINYNVDLKLDLKGGQKYTCYMMNAGYGTLNTKLKIQRYEPSRGFEDFVERLYVVALGRDSEPEGKAHWCKVVGNGSYSGADCARFFLTSPEFNGRNLNDEEYLKVLYKTFFDRDAAADPDGFNFWLSKIGEWGRGRVLEGFIDSTEWCNICADYGVRSGAMTAKATRASKNATAFATRLYTECLGREPEEGGLNYWSLSLTNQERTGTQAAKEFFYSEEFIGKNLGDDEYVNRLYKTFMGREPDDEGKAHWLNQLSSGAMNRDQVFDFFSTCEEFTGICNTYAIQR